MTEKKIKFLNYIKEHLSEKISKKVIETELGINDDEFAQLLKSLKNYGFKVIESDTHIWMESYPEIFSLTDIIIHTKVIGKKILPFFDVISTNDIALMLAIQGEKEGTVVISERQRKGRGKGGSVWFSPSDAGLWLSVIFRPKFHMTGVEKFTLLSAAVIVETVKELFNLDAWIKWPNDVMINDKKFCGILSEGKITSGTIDFIVSGIGINVNINKDEFPLDLQESSTSLNLELNQKVNRNDLFSAIMLNLDRKYELLKTNPEVVYKAWKQYSNIIGRRIKIQTPEGELEGAALDFDENGFLIIRLDSGIEKKITSGTITKVD
ncbi:biotin--[acetyl-CoA-carboxylase] ligase [Candidatus Dependentiae bacterium]|nr:biotin--[acetyl-CoA-carboxylase] ligase [Candidatus Dependentiae bacterium]